MIASPDCTFCTFGITTPNGDGCPNPICGLSITIAPAVQDEAVWLPQRVMAPVT